MINLILVLVAVCPEQEQRGYYLEDTVWMFERNTVVWHDAYANQWHLKGKYYLFWDLLPFPMIVDWRGTDRMRVIDRGRHYVLFWDTIGIRPVLRRVRFVMEHDSVTSVDKELCNRRHWSVENRRGLSPVGK